MSPGGQQPSSGRLTCADTGGRDHAWADLGTYWAPIGHQQSSERPLRGMSCGVPARQRASPRGLGGKQQRFADVFLG